ncbi:MAG TPA: TIGR02530 family flagellar biosynthesis protein [Myxococcota bacterium]|nr:TIGR02530 family flagellar biosynthesis protein [Myxococcota bacterium]
MRSLDAILPGIATTPSTGSRPGKSADFDTAFDQLLRDHAADLERPREAPELRFSRHAKARLESRGIELDDDDTAMLSGAIDRLADKGAKESLVLMDDNAFIVGVPKRTVITAMSRSEAMGNIFTGIDSTVVI